MFTEKQLERHERTLKFDAIASAYMAAGRLDPLTEQPDATPELETQRTAPAAENKWTMQRKHLFLSHFKLIQVSPSFKAGEHFVISSQDSSLFDHDVNCFKTKLFRNVSKIRLSDKLF